VIIYHNLVDGKWYRQRLYEIKFTTDTLVIRKTLRSTIWAKAIQMIDLFGAVLTGVGIFLRGQLLQRYVLDLDPLQHYRELIGKAAAAYTYYQGMATQLAPVDERIAARKELRSLTANLRACFWTVPFYEFQ
jgi:hypothetical protein